MFTSVNARWRFSARTAVENAAQHGEHARELAGTADPTSAGSGDRPGSEHQRLLRHERSGRSGLARSRSLGTQRRHRQFAQAEVRPSGCETPGAETLRGGPRPAAGGLVPASATARTEAASAATLLAGGDAGAGQEPAEQFAADVWIASSGGSL